ncbi:Patatin-like phospholipase [Methyloligella halotolerans]|uniref:Patatin-like phospholipase n=1 Tax=Methyloligella halotolerans TaxID=1177755 RepID=A0A1E2S2K7_9HYPH|nr:patatin-like phospholipase family protein [Methyloligella halotolerans]ODA68717.1 Patatin-like phospholipase [Methyloligella halotolerans]
MSDPSSNTLCRVLSLDGGGAKGFYTLGALKEIEALADTGLYEKFDLVFGTSTGAIIASMVALGYSVDEVLCYYREHVVEVMGRWLPFRKSAALQELSERIYGDRRFDSFKTDVGIVCTRWDFERPMIFKTSSKQAYAGAGTFVPGFGCTIGDAVVASCSAYPFFTRKVVTTSRGERIELADGGYCANNPALYAISDATESLGAARHEVRVVSIGVGEYPAPRKSWLSVMRWIGYLPSVRLLQKSLEINTQSMDQLRRVLFLEVPTIRINNRYTQPELATDIFEADLSKLDLLWQRGRDSAREVESELKNFLG